VVLKDLFARSHVERRTQPGEIAGNCSQPGEIVLAPKTGFVRATYLLQRLNALCQLRSLAYLGAVL
jgi:hypothetical protein